MMKNQILKNAITHWDYVAPLVAYPKNKKQYEKLVSYLDQLLDIVGENEKHSLMSLVDILSQLIASYEHERYVKKMGRGIDALRFLIDAHDLSQSDLPEIGSQGVVSEILAGKRSLNLRQIKLLSQRFNVSHATFIDD